MEVRRNEKPPRRFACAAAAGILLALANAAPLRGQSSADLRLILERLDRLEQQNRELAAEVRALRTKLEAAGPTVEERVKVQENRTAELAQTKVEASERFPIRLTGMALFNSFFNSKGSGGGEYPTIATPGRLGSGGATLRQTVLGLDYSGPRTFWNGKVSGQLRMDFFGGSGQPLDQAVRLRTATIGIDWRTRSLQAGLEKPLISPRDPNSIAQVGISPLTGAGNLWLWIPQFRVEQDFRFSEHSGLRAQIAAVQTRESNANAGSPSPYASDLESARPGLEGRFEFFAGDEHHIEIAPGFHRSVSHVAEASVPSNVFSLDWFARPWRPLEFTGAFFAGQNVANLGTGGIRQGFVVLYPRHVLPVHSRGGWAQLTYQATPRLSFNLFSGQQDDRNSDLRPGGIGKNLAFGANFFYRLAPNVLASFEVSQVRTNYLAAGTTLNNHYDLALAYLF